MASNSEDSDGLSPDSDPMRKTKAADQEDNRPPDRRTAFIAR